MFFRHSPKLKTIVFKEKFHFMTYLLSTTLKLPSKNGKGNYVECLRVVFSHVLKITTTVRNEK